MNTAFDEIGDWNPQSTSGPDATMSAPAHVLAFARGAKPFEFGDPADAVFRLETGLVRIARVDPDGRTHTLRHVLPGDVFAEQALVSAMHSEGSEALTDAIVNAYRPRYLTRKDLLVITRSLALQLHRMMDFGYHVQTGDLRQRVCRYLALLAGTDLCTRNAQGVATVSATHELLAEGTASTRESVSKVVSELRQDGCIRTGYRSIVLSDPAALAAEAARA